MDESGGMKKPDPHHRHRFPAEIISHAVWLYHVFSLSLRDVELILAERGVFVTHETIRRWCQKFGQSFATSLRHRRPRPGDKWHLDEVFVRIRGKLHYLWRAVDQHGTVLDILVQGRRNAKAARRFFKKLLKGLMYVPRVLVTDKLRRYDAAKRTILPTVEHRQSRYLNNRAENSHQPAGAPNAAVQVDRPRPVLLVDARLHLWPLPFAPAPHDRRRAPGGAGRRLPGLAGEDMRSESSLIAASSPPLTAAVWPSPVNVTTPSQTFRVAKVAVSC